MMIEAIHLTKQYGTAKALFDANFSIEKGEIVGFLGPNGAGKSTTMNLLCGYLTPSWGQVRIAGVDMASPAPIDQALQLFDELITEMEELLQ